MNDLQTGDILLFHTRLGLNPISWFARAIEYFTGSPYSHVGIVLVDPKFLPEPLSGYYLLESGEEPLPDAEDGRRKFGVQISDLQKIFVNYSGTIYKRSLVTTRPIQDVDLLRIYRQIHDKPYDIVPQDWIEVIIDKDPYPQKKDRFWCSALVGYVYTQLGLLPEETDWSIMRPCDFSCYNKRLPLQYCRLGNDVKII